MAKRARTEDTFRTNPEFIHKLISTPAETLTPPDRKVFIAQRTDKVTDVWKGLIKHDFLSVPVLQKTKRKYYGFMDVNDIVDFVIRTFESDKLSKDVDFWNQFEKEEVFSQKTVNDIMKSPRLKKNPFHPVSRGYSLFTVMEILSHERGLHRVAIIDDEFNLVNLITQSQIVKFLYENLKQLGGVKDRPISELDIKREKVLCINENEPAVNAFRKMIEENVSGLAVIDDAGKLVENISLRDLKAIQHDGRMFWRLHQTCKNFLQKIRKELTNPDQRPNHVLALTPTDKFEEVIKMAAIHGVHRVYIVNEEKKPVGVLSLQDILRETLCHA